MNLVVHHDYRSFRLRLNFFDSHQDVSPHPPLRGDLSRSPERSRRAARLLARNRFCSLASNKPGNVHCVDYQ